MMQGVVSRMGFVVAAGAVVLPWACSSAPECSFDIDCPGLGICSADGVCVDRPAGEDASGRDAGGPGDSHGSEDSGSKDTGGDTGRDGGDAGDAANDAGIDAGDAGRDGGDAGDAGRDGGKDGGDAVEDGGDGGCGECSVEGERACDGKSAYRVCEKSDGGCLQWGAQVTCDDGDECRQGGCGHDTCTGGATQCEGKTAYRVCASGNSQFLNWSDPIDCDPGAACDKTYCCPEEMAEVSGYCIDRWEAHASSSAPCEGSGTIYGRTGDDYPDGFPDKVGDGGLPETEKVYSCAAQGVKPSAFITYYQAAQACLNSGKHICTLDEWYTACSGPEGFEYPYGDQYEAAACNTSSAGAVAAGSIQRCAGSVGAFDMSGNLYEWAHDTARALGFQPIAGGAYNSGDTSSCSSTFNVSTSTIAGARGWRCCK